jgi:uncharacterized protein (TIGR02145 family)
MLDIKSTSKGMLIPRMTQSQIESIASPADALLVFCTNNKKFYTFMSTLNKWMEIAYGSTTISPGGFVCGDALLINHTSLGGVAPVSKMTTYGTMTGIAGEPSKCWITSNLGSDHQANAVNDNTEPSAGWYWQFNLKQGYKHDGSIRTPNSAWITIINQSLDWLAANDPCALELGTGWRLPTSTEWTNVDASGNWTNWNGPWNSLKLHAAGYLNYNDGSLVERGIGANYWSSTQFNSTNGWHLAFGSGVCYVNNSSNDKVYGFSVRCINSQLNP